MKNILLAFVFCLNFFSLYSQDKNQDLIIKFENDTLSAKKTKIIQTSLYLKNIGNEIISGELEVISTNDDIRFIKSIKQNVTLQPNDYIYIPVKAQLKPKINSTEIIVNASFKTNKKTFRQNLIIVPEKVRNVQIQLQNQHLNFFQVNDSINLNFEISNKGNTSETVNLVLKYPSGLNKNEFEAIELNLKPYQDTLIRVQKIVNRQMLKKEDFEIQASLYYKSGDYINSFPIYINSIKQNRTYKDLNIDDYRYHQNEIRLSNSYNSSSNQQNFNLGINSNVKISDNERLLVNSQMEYWQDADLFYLRNTVLGYQYKKLEANVGNLYQQGEIMINGIGAEVKYKLNDTLSIEAGYIDKTYSLIEPFKNSNGYAAWTTLNTTKSNGATTKTFLNYDLDYSTNINKYILYHSQEFIASENFKIVYQQGLSTMTDKDKVATGILAGISGIYTTNSWSYFGNHVISSNKYAGTRRGVFQINERIQYRVKNHSFSANYNYNDLNPESFNKTELFYTSQINQNASLGYRYNHRIFNFFLAPNYNYEKRTNPYFSSISLFEKVGLGFSFQINNFSRNLIFNTSFDTGKILSFNLENPYSYRITFGIKYKNLNLSSYYQYNYNSINELTNPDQLNKTYKNLNTNLMYTLNILNNRLNFSTYINYSLNNNLADVIVLNGSLNYEVNKKIRVYINSNYNKYLDGLAYSNLNLQAGLIKNFDPNKAKIKKVNLSIQVKYNEKNKVNTPAANKIVFINNKPFITDENGVVKYKKVPVGTYEIRLQNDNEWISESVSLQVNSDTNQEMLFNKTTTVSGFIDFEEGKNAYEVIKDKGAYRINLTNENGKTYKTYTDDSGRYNIYLPEGNYIISLVNHLSNSQTEVIDNDSQITTEIDKPVIKNFIIKIKDKKTEVKKFNSVKF